VTPFGFEPKTYCLEGSCSIQLSYGASFYSAWRQLLPSADGLSYFTSFYSAWRQLLPSADGLSYLTSFYSAWRQRFCSNYFDLQPDKSKKGDDCSSPLSGRQDSNLRPPGPKPGAMTGLRYAPSFHLIISNLSERFSESECKSNDFILIYKYKIKLPLYCGESGIRTRGTVTRTSV